MQTLKCKHLDSCLPGRRPELTAPGFGQPSSKRHGHLGTELLYEDGLLLYTLPFKQNN